jgi:hypothetical protein
MFTTPLSRLSEKLVASTQRGHQLQFTVIISLPDFRALAQTSPFFP